MSGALVTTYGSERPGVCNGLPAGPDADTLDLIAAQAAQAPSRLALSDGEATLSYGALDARAGRLAGHLVARGAGHARVVLVFLPRSIHVVVAALAALKAGAAYAWIEPSAPPGDLAAVVADARPGVIVTRRGLASRIPRGVHALVELDGDAAAIERQVATPREPRAELASLAYASGARRVELTHLALLQLVRRHHQALHLTVADRAPLLAGPAAPWEPWPYLAAGTSLHLPDDLVSTDPEALRDWLIEQDITVAFVPAPMAERLLGLPWPSRIRLRVLLTDTDTLGHVPAAPWPFEVVTGYRPALDAPVTGARSIVEGLVRPRLAVGERPLADAA